MDDPSTNGGDQELAHAHYGSEGMLDNEDRNLVCKGVRLKAEFLLFGLTRSEPHFEEKNSVAW